MYELKNLAIFYILGHFETLEGCILELISMRFWYGGYYETG